MEHEIRADAVIAENTWKPERVADRDMWVCRCYAREPGGKTMKVVTLGATLRKEGQPPKFSPLYLFREDDAQAKCDDLNNMSGQVLLPGFRGRERCPLERGGKGSMIEEKTRGPFILKRARYHEADACAAIRGREHPKWSIRRCGIVGVTPSGSGYSPYGLSQSSLSQAQPSIPNAGGGK